MSMDEKVGPFESHESLVANLRSYKSMCNTHRAFELSDFWDFDELEFIRSMFDSGDAYALI